MFLPKINFLLVLLIGLLLIVLQTTAFQLLFKNFRPDLILVLVVYLAFHRYAGEGAILSFLLGYFVELHSGAPTGLMMTVYVWIFIVAKLVGLGFFLTRIWGTFLVVALMSLLEIIFIWGLSYLVLPIAPDFWNLLLIWIPSLGLQLLATPLFFRGFSWFDGVCYKESPSKITGALGTPLIST